VTALSAVDSLSVPAEPSEPDEELPSAAADGAGFAAGVSLQALRATAAAMNPPQNRLWTAEFAMGSLGAADGEAATSKASSVARLAA
jgi:hypothetical protein